jgi:thioredoxin reductase
LIVRNSEWECIVVGGGAAGLSAALVLGRARRKTLVVDAGGQSNLPAHGIGGLLGHDGRSPAELYAAGRSELAAYPTVEVRDTEAVSGKRDGSAFVLDLADGSRETARRVLLATGMDYRLPQVPGIAPLWGRSVFHCPFCHGWEARDLSLGVLDPSPHGVLRALLLQLWSDDVTLFSNGPAQISDSDVERLHRAGIAIDERRVAALRSHGEELTSIEFEDGSQRPCGGLLVAVTLHQRSAIAEQLGAAFAPRGPVAADALEVNQMFQTSVPGLFAAGDVSAQMQSVANAVAAGSNAAAGIVHSLLAEDHDLAH